MNTAKLEAVTARLQRLAEAAAQEKALSEPYCVICVYDLRGEGVTQLEYYPEGKRGKRQVLEGLTVSEALEWADTRQIEALVNMMFCPLWCYAFYRRCGLYTDEQLELFRQRDIEKYDDVAEIAVLPEAEQIIDRISRIPQFWTIYPSKDKKGGK